MPLALAPGFSRGKSPELTSLITGIGNKRSNTVSRESSKTILKKKNFYSGSVTVYAGNIKSFSRLLRSWTEAWIGQAPTEKFLVSFDRNTIAFLKNERGIDFRQIYRPRKAIKASSAYSNF